MNVSDFNYNLPESLIAQTPLENRSDSRMLIVDREEKSYAESTFTSILDELVAEDVLVVNKTRVINARLLGYTELTDTTSGKTHKREVEVFLVQQKGTNSWDCMVSPARRLPVGKEIFICNSEGERVLEAKIIDVSYTGRILEFNLEGFEFYSAIENIGEIPLPPYITERLEDSERYQSIFNKTQGSVAAPTASLHFTPEIVAKLQEKGVIIEEVLLHIGPGTFKPVDTEDIEDYVIHSEYIELEKDVSERLNRYKKNGKRIIAVGTTSVRVLESFTGDDGMLLYGAKDTGIFIYPGYKWKYVDSLITNFHLPKSTLLMLVSSLAGRELILESYNYAVENKFRFFSFGDVMWIK